MKLFFLLIDILMAICCFKYLVEYYNKFIDTYNYDKNNVSNLVYYGIMFLLFVWLAKFSIENIL